MEIDDIGIRGLGRDTVRMLSRRSDFHGLAQLATHTGLLAASGCLVWSSPGGWWLGPAMVLHGIILVFLFCPLHECIHRTAFANRGLNDAVAWFCGVLLILPPEYFRLFHFTHHRHTQDPARDPELAAPMPRSIAAYAWRVSGLPFWYERIRVTLRHAITARVPETFIPAARVSFIVREARILSACYLAVLGISLLVHRADALLYWVLPAVAGQPFLRLFLMAEHTGCRSCDDMFVNTRTTYTNIAVRTLTWRMSYHSEHHAFPSVPFHALSKVNALVRQRIVATPGYLRFHLDLLSRMSARESRVTSTRDA